MIETKTNSKMKDKLTLYQYIHRVYFNNPHKAVAELTDDVFLASMGWVPVFHEGVGDGVWSPEEGIVAVFDEDDLDTYWCFSFYKYNADAWPTMDKLNEGVNGEGYEVELEEGGTHGRLMAR